MNPARTTLAHMTPPRRRGYGFSLIEIVVVLGLIAIFAAIAAGLLSQLRTAASRRGSAADLYGAMVASRHRALARQRTQLVVISTVADTSETFGHYEFEDATTPPNIYSSTDLSTILAVLNPAIPVTAPAPYSLRRIDSTTVPANPYYANADSWSGTPMPFPWRVLAPSGNPTGPVSTAAGCSFCSLGRGIVGFLPNGRAIFSDGNVLGGLTVVVGSGNANLAAGVGVSPTGFVQLLERR